MHCSWVVHVSGWLVIFLEWKLMLESWFEMYKKCYKVLCHLVRRQKQYQHLCTICRSEKGSSILMSHDISLYIDIKSSSLDSQSKVFWLLTSWIALGPISLLLHHWMSSSSCVSIVPQSCVLTTSAPFFFCDAGWEVSLRKAWKIWVRCQGTESIEIFMYLSRFTLLASLSVLSRRKYFVTFPIRVKTWYPSNSLYCTLSNGL